MARTTTFVIETTAGAPVFHIPFPISTLAEFAGASSTGDSEGPEHVEFIFRNSGGTPTFHVGGAEVGVSSADAWDYATVVRRVMRAREARVKAEAGGNAVAGSSTGDGVQVEVRIKEEHETPRILQKGKRKTREVQETSAEDTPRPQKDKRKARNAQRSANPATNTQNTNDIIEPTPVPNTQDMNASLPPPPISLNRPYSHEETLAFERGSLTDESFAKTYNGGRRDFAAQCDPSQPPHRPLTPEEEAEWGRLWEALLRLDRVSCGPSRDIAALTRQGDEMLAAAARRLYPALAARSAPPSQHTPPAQTPRTTRRAPPTRHAQPAAVADANAAAPSAQTKEAADPHPETDSNAPAPAPSPPRREPVSRRQAPPRTRKGPPPATHTRTSGRSPQEEEDSDNGDHASATNDNDNDVITDDMMLGMGCSTELDDEALDRFRDEAGRVNGVGVGVNGGGMAGGKGKGRDGRRGGEGDTEKDGGGDMRGAKGGENAHGGKGDKDVDADAVVEDVRRALRPLHQAMLAAQGAFLIFSFGFWLLARLSSFVLRPSLVHPPFALIIYLPCYFVRFLAPIVLPLSFLPAYITRISFSHPARYVVLPLSLLSLFSALPTRLLLAHSLLVLPSCVRAALILPSFPRAPCFPFPPFPIFFTLTLRPSCPYSFHLPPSSVLPASCISSFPGPSPLVPPLLHVLTILPTSCTTPSPSSHISHPALSLLLRLIHLLPATSSFVPLHPPSSLRTSTSSRSTSTSAASAVARALDQGASSHDTGAGVRRPKEKETGTTQENKAAAQAKVVENGKSVQAKGNGNGNGNGKAKDASQEQNVVESSKSAQAKETGNGKAKENGTNAAQTKSQAQAKAGTKRARPADGKSGNDADARLGDDAVKRARVEEDADVDKRARQGDDAVKENEAQTQRATAQPQRTTTQQPQRTTRATPQRTTRATPQRTTATTQQPQRTTRARAAAAVQAGVPAPTHAPKADATGVHEANVNETRVREADADVTRMNEAKANANATGVRKAIGNETGADEPELQLHKAKSAYMPAEEPLQAYTAWVPVLPSSSTRKPSDAAKGEDSDTLHEKTRILTPAERAWLGAQGDLARAPDWFRPVHWEKLGARMYAEWAARRAAAATSTDEVEEIRPLYHGTLALAWDRGEWRFPGHERVGRVGVPWAVWVRGEEGRRWRT
ncbi:hypothetical protein C8R44DRAFT_991376 [Mycena epipterygia]|nr:hypothetical protein C8R44DRAFT_991376 [Mycena epipterygia]